MTKEENIKLAKLAGLYPPAVTPVEYLRGADLRGAKLLRSEDLAPNWQKIAKADLRRVRR